MKRHIFLSVMGVLCLSLFCGYPLDYTEARAQGRTVDQVITVLSPAGQPPPIRLMPMAPRPDSLDGKTIYLVNDGYLGTDILLGEMESWFKDNMPEVKTVYRQKGGGGFTAEDPQLWAEIKEQADAVVMGMGH